MEVGMCGKKSQKLANWKKSLNIYKKFWAAFQTVQGLRQAGPIHHDKGPEAHETNCQKHWEAFKGMQSPLRQKVIWWVTLTTYTASQHSLEDFHNSQSLKIYLLNLSIYNPKLLHNQRNRKILKYFEKN